MARPKPRRVARATQHTAPARDWLPLSALAGIMAGFLLAYLAAEMALYLRPHPLHWLVAAIGGGVGYAGGLAWDIWQSR